MPTPALSYVSKGAIPVGAAVKHTTNRGEVIVGGNNDFCFAITWTHTHDVPGISSSVGASSADGQPVALVLPSEVGFGLAHGTIAKGDLVKWDGTGLVTIAATGGTGQMVVGIAEEPASSGNYFLVRIWPMYKVYPAIS